MVSCIRASILTTPEIRLAFSHPRARISRCSTTRSVNTCMKAALKEVVSTDQAPGAVGPYSQAIKTGNLVFLSGQVGLVPGTKNLIGDDVASQTEQSLKNLGAVLQAAGSSFQNVTKTTVLLTSMSDFATVNEIYSKFFPDKPARACYAVKELPLGAKVEIEAIAVTDQPGSRL